VSNTPGKRRVNRQPRMGCGGDICYLFLCPFFEKNIKIKILFASGHSAKGFKVDVPLPCTVARVERVPALITHNERVVGARMSYAPMISYDIIC